VKSYAKFTAMDRGAIHAELEALADRLGGDRTPAAEECAIALAFYVQTNTNTAMAAKRLASFLVAWFRVYEDTITERNPEAPARRVQETANRGS